MISLCPNCHNLTQYCTCAKIATADHTTLLPSIPPQHHLLPQLGAFKNEIEPNVFVDVKPDYMKSMNSTAYFSISPADFDKIRTLVHEEIEKALMDEEDSYEPRVVVIDGKPKIHIEFEYEGQLYAGDAYAVEKKYD